MRKLLSILLLFITSFGFAQVDTTHLKGQYFMTNWLHKNKLKIVISRWEEIDPVKIKGRLYIIPYKCYLENKKLVESRIDLNKCVIRRVRRDELLKPNN